MKTSRSNVSYALALWLVAAAAIVLAFVIFTAGSRSSRDLLVASVRFSAS